MKSDMHLHATYALAVAAGFSPEDAGLIARSAQEVDRAFHYSPCNRYGEQVIACAQPADRVETIAGVSTLTPYQQWSVWAPFHFVPALEGADVESRMLCGPRGTIFQALRAWAGRDLPPAGDAFRPKALVRLGVASHVLCDAYSHEGFSGIWSRMNQVRSGTVRASNGVDAALMNRLMAEALSPGENSRDTDGLLARLQQADALHRDWLALIGLAGKVDGVAPVGHGLAVLSLPDLPFLRWEVAFEKPRNGQDPMSFDNPARFLAACQSLFGLLASHGNASLGKTWGEIEPQIQSVLALHAGTDDRCRAWDGLTRGWVPASAPLLDRKCLGRGLGMGPRGLDPDTHEEIHAFDEAATEWRERFKTVLQLQDTAAYEDGERKGGWA